MSKSYNNAIEDILMRDVQDTADIPMSEEKRAEYMRDRRMEILSGSNTTLENVLTTYKDIVVFQDNYLPNIELTKDSFKFNDLNSSVTISIHNGIDDSTEADALVYDISYRIYENGYLLNTNAVASIDIPKLNSNPIGRFIVAKYTRLKYPYTSSSFTLEYAFDIHNMEIEKIYIGDMPYGKIVIDEEFMREYSFVPRTI